MNKTLAKMTTAMNETRHFEVIVIGAGMSGLACASRLYQNSHYQQRGRLLVLEGRERIGGRIANVHVNGSRLDTGANWIHGIGTKEEPNPLMKVLPHKKYKQLSGMVAFKAHEMEQKLVASELSDDDWVDVSGTFEARSDGDRVIPAKIAGGMMGAVWETIDSLHEAAAVTPASQAKHKTMLKAITESKVFQEAYESTPEEYQHTFGSMLQFIESMEAAPLATQSAEHPEDRPGMSLLEFGIDDFDGDQVFLQDGYTAVIEEIAEELIKNSLVETGVKVHQIRWGNDPIVIETSNGLYSAGQVVCTIPLGILQHNLKTMPDGGSSEDLFYPHLPLERQEAIRSLGFGTLDKIFLVYDDIWWEKEPYYSTLKRGIVDRPFDSENAGADSSKKSFDTIIGFTDELSGIEIHKDGTTSTSVCSLTLVNHHTLTGFPVLSAFVSCAKAVEVEAMSDEEAGAILHRAMNSWFGREPPKPAAVHVTRWAQDEFSRGSYSHMITGLTEVKHREIFQEPIKNKHGGVLRFAGEHTSRNHFATAHGALISGWREAGAILKHVIS